MVRNGILKLGLCLAALHFSVGMIFDAFGVQEPDSSVWALLLRSLIYGQFLGLSLAWLSYKQSGSKRDCGEQKEL